MSQNGQPKTLFEKIWDQHVVVAEPGNPAVLYIDLHLIHEVTSPQAFTALREKELKVRRPDKIVATMDHGIPTTPPNIPITDMMVLNQINQLEKNCRDFNIPLHGMHSAFRGIVHVIGPELGLTQPGMTIVCGDSHTSNPKPMLCRSKVRCPQVCRPRILFSISSPASELAAVRATFSSIWAAPFADYRWKSA
jgi:homoaconitase/3-isopropylmalate dehydratase large subunit